MRIFYDTRRIIRRYFTVYCIITLTRCLASLIASNPDKRKRDKTLAATVILLTESMARLEKAFEADALKRPEEGGGE